MLNEYPVKKKASGHQTPIVWLKVSSQDLGRLKKKKKTESGKKQKEYE